uniref:NADH-ubiquinone oxidoreductase chain 6 n=1 Tax=Cordylepherus sp. YY-2021 TaxID=2811245 RepID=A0A891M416_9CUCU|nr:NADH dehydrogenase subunit 6 [Cordylepherus sp. YY-2021]
MMMLNYSIIFLSIMMIFMLHPLSMGAIMLLQTLIISLMIGLTNFNYWLSYILFIVMVGGLLILFIYMTSIASNEKFKMSNFLLYLMMLMMIMMIMTFIIDQFYFYMQMNNINMNFLNVNNNFKLLTNKFINFPSNLIFYITILYLLITLIACVKITSTFKGPMRQLNN